MLLKIAAIIAVLGPVASLGAEVTSALDCKQVYDTATSDFGLEKQCQALVEFSKCLSAFPESGLMENELFKRNSKACEPFWKAAGEPTMRTKRGNFQLTVDDAKQVNFYRHRREEINVFDMNAQIVELQQMVATLTQNMTNVEDSVQVKIDDLKQEQKEALDDKSDELDKKSADLDTKLTQGMEANKNALDQTVGDLSDKVDQSAAATTAALDKSKKDAATANTVFKKTITDSIDSKLKPFSGADKAIASLKNTHYGDSSIPVFRYAQFHTYQARQRWFDGNRASGFGGVAPSSWTDNNYRADQMGNDFKYLQRIFTRKGQASKFGGTICAEGYGQRSSTNGLVCGALFRIRNTGNLPSDGHQRSP